MVCIDKLKIPLCEKCKSQKVYRFGYATTKNGKKQKYQCQNCGYVWREK